MLDALDHLTDILIGLAILFLVPLIYSGLKQDTLIRTIVSEQTEQLIEETRSQGYLSREMYEDYQQSLAKTGFLYDIKLEHKQKILEPEYRFRTIDEILEEQNKAFTGTNIYHSYPVSTNIPVVSDSIDNSGLTMNTDTNESILARATTTPSTGHVHTDACYSGHRHVDPYSSISHSNAPVIFTALRDEVRYNGAYNLYYTYTVDIMCASCYERLYSIGIATGGAEVYILEVTYSSNAYGGSVASNRFFTLPGSYNSSTALAGNIAIGNVLSLYNHAKASGAAADQWSAADACYYNLPGIPHIGNDGRLYYTPFNGCIKKDRPSSSYGKIHGYNKNACYPLGKKSKVNMNFNRYYDSDSNASIMHVDVFCADCNKQVVSLRSAYYSPGSTSRYSSYYSTSWYGYDTDGTIKEFRTDSGGGSGSYFSPGSSFAISNGIIREAYNLLSSYFNSNNTYKVYENGTMYRTVTPVYFLDAFPVRLSVVAAEPISYVNYLGCPYCGTYGTAYTCGQVDNYILACDKKVISISPTHPVQSVYTNESLITTVIATYLDGSTKVVLATSYFSTATATQNQRVTLTYTDAFGTAHTTTITVNVIPRNKTCSHGHVYKLNNDGSDPGCPFCRQWLASLYVEFPTTPNFTIYRGTTLSGNGVTLLATYLDGHTELIETEYIDNLDRYYVGSQYVTMSYKGHNAYLTVVTKRNLKLCPVCHRQYELHPDDSEPGCPWCAARTPVFTGNVMQYYNKRYTNDIRKALYEGAGTYRFSDKDFITISVKSRRGSIGTRLLSTVYLNNEVNTIHVIESGYIREDGQR